MNGVSVFFIYFVLWPTNAQLFHKLSHSYMFRHYRVIFRELVINTLPSYTSISNAAVGNTIYNIKIVLFTIKWTKIILLLQFSWSQSVWWPYVVCICKCVIPVVCVRVCVCVCVCEWKLERVCSQTQLCHLRCFNDYTRQLHVSASYWPSSGCIQENLSSYYT